MYVTYNDHLDSTSMMGVVRVVVLLLIDEVTYDTLFFLKMMIEDRRARH